MNSEQIIKQGEMIKLTDVEPSMGWLVAGIIGMVLMLILAIWAMISQTPIAMIFFIPMVMIGFSIYFTNTDEYKNNKYQKKVDEWMQTAVVPYIENLPIEKASIISMLQTEYGDFNVKFKDSDGEIQEIKAVKVDRTLEESGTPYVKYTKLRTDLGHGVTKGIQTSVVYVSPNVYVPKMTDDEVTE